MNQPAGYSGTPLPRKLGVQATSRVLLIPAPAGFALDSPATQHRRGGSSPCDVALMFCRSRRELTGSPWPGVPAVWVCWPKKASGVVTDLTEDVLREVVLPTGWVDVKVCAVDTTWSGLLFRRRRT